LQLRMCASRLLRLELGFLNLIITGPQRRRSRKIRRSALRIMGIAAIIETASSSPSIKRIDHFSDLLKQKSGMRCLAPRDMI
jgi:hypothetical protein